MTIPHTLDEMNVNEKEETQQELFDAHKIIAVTKKMDGMMIAPFYNNGEIVWGSKRASQDIHNYIVQSGILSEDIISFVKSNIDVGFTPIFEFHDPAFEPSRIVVKYDKAFLKLIAVRDMDTGDYLDREYLEDIAEDNNLDLVENIGSFLTLQEIIDHVQTLEGEEGFVIHVISPDGKITWLKIKSPWYVRRHHVKSIFEFDYVKAQLVLDCNPEASFDDIAPYMDDDDRTEYETFAEKLHAEMEECVHYIETALNVFMTKKAYGLSGESQGNPLACVMFAFIENRAGTNSEIFDYITHVYVKNCTRETKFKEFRKTVKEVLGND